ncbi:MAG: acetate--CoA ligase [Chloroflexi bacterium]|nr:acetate--CoA ligase [Chloroflexota bacterium]MBU1750785.1 acetate--CoA ligase [Chloroflexota bacterium]
MLDMFFNPQSVAVIGASREPEKLGYGVLHNIVQYGYQGAIYPINPKADEILGLPAYPSILDTPGDVELAVIVVPGKFVPGVLRECGQKGVRGVVIISAGFRETGTAGLKAEHELMSIAREYDMRIIGPNCLGIIDTVCSLNASFAAGMPVPGEIAFMSQSGALCTAILDWAVATSMGFSRFVSFGNKADVSEVDLLQAWGEDDHTKVIIAYLEAITDGELFLKTARRVTHQKPIIAIKSGTTSAGSKAVSSHTGSLAGSEQAYETAFRQCGVIRANSVQELFDLSVAFVNQPPLQGNRVVIVTNAGGPGIMATDALEVAGLQLASLARETVDTLREYLPPAANFYNPVDVLGDSLADRYGQALDTVLQDANVDGAVVILTPQAMTQIVETARVIGQIAPRCGKPVVSCFMGQERVSEAYPTLREAHIPNYGFPEHAINALGALYQYQEWLSRPEPEILRFKVDPERAHRAIETARDDHRLTLGEMEAREVIAAYGIPVPNSRLAESSDQAVQLANEIGYPVVMKIISPDILHKSDVGGVKVGMINAAEVRDAFDLIMYRARRFMPDADIWGISVQQMVPQGKELIIGVNRDPQFGPLIMFGMGGIYVEVLKDVTFRLAPLSRLDADEMIREIRTYRLLRGVRGEPPVDFKSIIEVLLRVSQLVTDFPEIVELDINPLMALEDRAMAVDMRMVVEARKEYRCQYCGEIFDVDPIRRGKLIYCSAACAFEATRLEACDNLAGGIRP